ncbi:sugar phosphate isomerase/epimerase family protein [Gehongia tenuis]|uniref:Sugar phosphate isomerase/epimerase n=1 Tax=Gehongia tenuis TaxID=2763655 RepID=A0A926D580_9FIRM|nr:sugar phosphate isomerase/epimerase family protein [Gehongia tenuis]MBC8530595.1 sugar phosphate isomerase/epimerase [Gehongia tenuis]
MRLGMYCNYTEKTAEFASRVGFESMELAVWSRSTVNPNITDGELARVMKDLEKRDIEISAIGCYPNHIHPDKEFAKDNQAYFHKVIDLAHRMGVTVIGTHGGNDYFKSIEENIPEWKECFYSYCDHAAKYGVKIAIENCPMVDVKTQFRNNLAYSPEIWEVLFGVLPAENLGLEFDPAHMIWQGIDYVQAVLDFGHKIFHVHAKDVEVRRKQWAKYGMFGPQIGNDKYRKGPRSATWCAGWDHHWRGRAVGWGDVNWPKFISALVEVGYEGNMDVEHEDKVFLKQMLAQLDISEEQDLINNYSTEENGLILAYNHLRPLVPPHR